MYAINNLLARGLVKTRAEVNHGGDLGPFIIPMMFPFRQLFAGLEGIDALKVLFLQFGQVQLVAPKQSVGL